MLCELVERALSVTLRNGADEIMPFVGIHWKLCDNWTLDIARSGKLFNQEKLILFEIA